MPPDVLVLVGDCLRAASATDRTLPFCRDAADLRFERCYAPGTWTLPSYASLYAGATPIEHGVTRWDDRLGADQAWLPETARGNGYVTVTVGENPTASARYGFDHGIDVPDDFVNAKLYPSAVAPETSVDAWPDDVHPVLLPFALLVGLPGVLGAAARSDRPVQSLANVAYAPFAYGRDRLRSPRSRWPATGFPHHGERVLAHLERLLEASPDRLRGDSRSGVGSRADGRAPADDRAPVDGSPPARADSGVGDRSDPPAGDRSDPPARDADAPVLAIANLLEPHNPHSVPPEGGASALGLEVSGIEQRRLAAVDDNRRYLFESPDVPPPPTVESFPTWDDVFARREEIYEAQVREFDRLVEGFAADLGERFDEALVVVTGDHGQLFGEEGSVGHHTSLHPHAIHVPLLASLPASWTDEAGGTGPSDRRATGGQGAGTPTVEEPVSLVGLSRAIGGVVAGEVETAEAFVERVRSGDGEGPVLAAVDGPNWSVADLEAAYGADAVSDLAVRKVGLVDGDLQVVLASPWDDDRISVTEYELSGGDRTRLAAYEREEWVAASEEAERVSDALGEDRLAAIERWLAPERPAVEAGPASNRLRQLGYR